jgi:hypothetical protein
MSSLSACLSSLNIIKIILLMSAIGDSSPSLSSRRKNDAHMTSRNFQEFRVLGSTLRVKAQADTSSRGWKDSICREEKRKAAGRYEGDPETSGPLGQVGNCVFILFFLPEGGNVS